MTQKSQEQNLFAKTLKKAEASCSSSVSSTFPLAGIKKSVYSYL